MRKAVLGIGNPLLGDDAVGLQVLKALNGVDADLVDFGWGMDVSLLRKYGKVAIVDAGLFKGRPGEVREFGLEELPAAQMPSTHGVNLVFLLKKLGNPVKDLRFFLIQPEKDDKMSDSVKKAIPIVSDLIKAFLED